MYVGKKGKGLFECIIKQKIIIILKRKLMMIKKDFLADKNFAHPEQICEQNFMKKLSALLFDYTFLTN